MACDEDPEWSQTPIAGLQVRAEGAGGIRLLGWEGVVPLTVIRTVVDCTMPTAGPPAVPAMGLTSVREHPGGRPQSQHGHRSPSGA